MKTILNFGLSLALVFAFCTQANAQSSVKEMNKDTKSELKKYMKDPASYRKMIKNYEDQLEEFELQMAEVNEDFYKADYLRVLYYDSIQELHAQNNKIEIKMENGNIGGPASGSSMYSNVGTDYRVQIGAYRFFDFTELLQFNQPIGYENVNGVIHYYLGSWENAEEAYEFAVAIRRLEIEGAFVTKYINGQRTPYDHLMESGRTAFIQN